MTVPEEECWRILDRLANAAHVYSAVQFTARDPRCAVQQPVTVAEAEELNAALEEAFGLLEDAHPGGEHDRG